MAKAAAGGGPPSPRGPQPGPGPSPGPPPAPPDGAATRPRDFLRASIRRDRRRRGRAVAVLSTLLVLALGAFAIATVQGQAAAKQQRAAEEGQRAATARLLISQATALLDRDPRTALRLGETAQALHPSPETRSALVNEMLTTPYAGTL